MIQGTCPEAPWAMPGKSQKETPRRTNNLLAYLPSSNERIIKNLWTAGVAYVNQAAGFSTYLIGYLQVSKADQEHKYTRTKSPGG